MAPFSRFYQWLGLRTEEARVLWLSFSGAFLVMSYLVLARSLREAFYLDAFNVKTLPFMTLTYVALGLPTAATFSYFLAGKYAQTVLRKGILIGMAGLLLILSIPQWQGWVIILFYLWTVLLGIILTSGLWLVISEHFHVRRAKRLYGWVSAGGTLGTMITGISLVPLTRKFPILRFSYAVPVLLILFYIVLSLLPKPEGIIPHQETQEEKRMSFLEGIRLVFNSPYLSIIVMIVMSATLASTLLDFQFKEYVQHLLKEKIAMVGFFGSFYGWVGVISLFIQIVVTSRFLSKAGIGWTLSILPLILIAGSTGFFLLPSFIIAAGVRGFDQSLRKSFHRSAIEVLYVPVPPLLRKKTKTFIDSVLDSVAEALGALIIFGLVTWGNIPSRYLSILIIFFAGILLYHAQKMNRQYYDTLKNQLREKGEELENSDGELPAGGDLLATSFSSIDLKGTMDRRGIIFKDHPRLPDPHIKISPTSISSDALQGKKTSELLPLLVQDHICGEVCSILIKRGAKVVPELVETMVNEDADFVIRRRIPKVLAKIPTVDAEKGLLQVLHSQRFEVRYRAAMALMKRYQTNYPHLPEETRKKIVWEAIRFEVNRDRPVWEMQTILDTLEESERDEFPQRQLEARGQLSLEHVFRMLALIFDPKLISASYQGLATEKTKLKSFSLEYLEHILPEDVREKLWLFIGDITEYQKQKETRPLEEVADELLKTGATLLGDKETKRELMAALENIDDKKSDAD
jgi:ATP/ADP translocase